MTPREKEVLDFIKVYIVRQGYSPSYAEMVTNSGESSKSGVHRVVSSLEEQGLITRNHGNHQFKARCIELVEGSDWKNSQRVALAASLLMASIIRDDVDDATGEGTVTVNAKAFGDLDVALAEASPERKAPDDE